MKAKVIKVSNYRYANYVEVNTIEDLLEIDIDGYGVIVTDYRNEDCDYDIQVAIYDDYIE